MDPKKANSMVDIFVWCGKLDPEPYQALIRVMSMFENRELLGQCATSDKEFPTYKLKALRKIEDEHIVCLLNQVLKYEYDNHKKH